MTHPTHPGEIPPLARRAGDPSLTPFQQEGLYQSNHPDALRMLSRNPSLEVSLVERMAARADLRSFVADHPRLPLHLQERFARDSDVDLRIPLASNPSLAPHLMGLLARDPDETVRCVIAYRPDRPSHVAEMLLADQSKEVRAALAMGPAITHSLCVALAKDPDPQVRRCLGQNDALRPDPSLPARFLQEIFPLFLEEHLEGLDKAVWSTLLQNWEGSLASLASATRLLH